MSRSRRRMIFPLRVFGRSAVKMISAGRAIAPISSTTCCLRSSSNSGPGIVAFARATRTPRPPGLSARRRVRRPQPRPRASWSTRADLDLHRADPVARHVQNVVHPPHDPEVAVVVLSGAVAREVNPRRTSTSRSPDSALRRRRCRAAWRARVTRSRGIRSPPARPVDPVQRPRCPEKATVAEPGFVVMAPGRGVIMIAPVSVCHQVSTIGQRPPPMCSWYHVQASGLIGSPTVPSSRSLDRSLRAGQFEPHFMKARIAVGRGVQDRHPYFSHSSQKRPLSGQSGRALVHHLRRSRSQRAVDDV